jgi:hypothetical protein
MPSLKAQFPSKYLKAADLEGKEVPVKIREFKLENVAGEGRPPENKPVAYFEGKDKGVVLNKTNADTLALLFGDDTDLMVGQTVVLFPTTVSFQGKTVDAIRMKGSGQATAQALNDEIPF